MLSKDAFYLGKLDFEVEICDLEDKNTYNTLAIHNSKICKKICHFL